MSSSNKKDPFRILYIVPGSGLSIEEIARRKLVLNSFASSSFKIDVKQAKSGTVSIESYYDEFTSVPQTIKMAIRAEKDGYDALILGCFGDPGLEAIREVVDIPVAGAGESSIHLASMLGEDFTILTILDSVRKSMKKYVKKVGLFDRLASVRAIGIPVTEIRQRGVQVYENLKEEGRKAVSQDGADALILGCMSEGFLGITEKLTKELRIPVVNPVSASLKMAELFLSCNLSHSRLAYLLPPKLTELKKHNFGI